MSSSPPYGSTLTFVWFLFLVISGVILWHARTQLTRARVVTDSSGKEESISTVARVSQTAWLREFSHPTIAAIKARIEAVTGLSADTEQQHCEQYQVANYGIGGHYVPHYDYIFKDVPEPEREKLLTDENRHNGDRISTFMIYVSLCRQIGDIPSE